MNGLDDRQAYPAHGVVTTTASTDWQDSMITGNGTIGLIVPGGTKHETLTLCHERLFLPFNEPMETVRLADHLDEYRRLIECGRADEAAGKMWKDAGIKFKWTDPFVPAFRLNLDLPDWEGEAGFLRKTDYRTGVVTTRFSSRSGQPLQRDAFVSRADSVVVVRMHSDRPFTAALSMAGLPDPANDAGRAHAGVVGRVEARYEPDLMIWKTVYKNQWEERASGFCSAIRLVTDGRRVADSGCVRVEAATSILLLVSLQVGISPELPRLDGAIEAVAGAPTDYDTLLSRHVAVHQPLYDRVDLSLHSGATPREHALLSEASVDAGVSLARIEQVFRASRYAIICSTGELPPNLQGVWSGNWIPPWSGDYTLNGNVNTAVAFGLNGNFPEVTLALCNLIERFTGHYRVNARNIFGCNGYLVPGRLSDNGYSNHFLDCFPHNYWMAGSAWYARYFFDYWQYTQDEDFLKERAIPFMLECARFYEEVVYPGGGKLRFCPSYSPENRPLNQQRPLSLNATMDVAACKELLRSLISLADREDVPADRVATWKRMLAAMPEYRVDETGAFKEWLDDAIPENQAHRHASQLYPLYHEVDPDIAASPELQEACRQTVEQRLVDRRQNDGGVMAFGLYQLAQASANLKDSVRAEECVRWMAKRYWSPAFTCYHNPGKIFNTDICGGFPAAVIQMLMQSSLTEIELLPALPESWPSGSIRGICARGGVEVDIDWNIAESSVELAFRASRSGRFALRFPAAVTGCVSDLAVEHSVLGDHCREVTFEAGREYRMQVTIDFRRSSSSS